jgi:hypothetical protein
VTHPMMAIALQNERELEFELDGARRGIDRLNRRIERVMKDGGYVEHDRKTRRELAELVAVGGLVGKLACMVRGW